MIQSIPFCHALLFVIIALSSPTTQASSHHHSPFYHHHALKSRTRSSLASKNLPSNSFLPSKYSSLRGGGDVKAREEQDDEERYSRQVYTLGSRAHSLVRKSTIIVDGPPRSGLVYESIKNLALSGVGKIVLLENDMGSDNGGLVDEYYFDQHMDDLGAVYRHGALRECFPDRHDEGEVDDTELMAEYIRRINPNVKVRIIKRSEFLETFKSSDKIVDEEETVELVGTNPVLLCVDRPLSTQILLNEACRMIGSDFSERLSMSCIPFVSIETAGVYGKVFCDFGDEFQVVDEDGETPKTTLLHSVERTDREDDKEVVIKCIEGERHDVSKGDVIAFQVKNGSLDETSEILDTIECMVTYVKNPTCFHVKFCSAKDNHESIEGSELEDIMDCINNKVNGFSRVKVPKAIPFLSLEKALAAQDDPSENLFAASDLEKSFDLIRRSAIMASFATLESVTKAQSALPNLSDEHDFVDAVMASTSCDDNKQLKSIVSSFARCAKAKFTPLQAIFGALGAQEVLKAASGLYNPIKQFLLYDCDEVLIHSKPSTIESDDSHTSGMKYILGKSLLKKLSSQKIFVVGSGAIGCELLKNLAAMNVGTRKKKGGCIILTDMDTIEKSNLSRQLLFRDADVGKFKSMAAQEAIQRLNPKVHIVVHTSKVGDQTKETYFDDKFWSEGVDVVLNALDNVDARLFIDSQCVANKKPLVDAGTLGAKGNVQVVVPCQSESYASSTDPPEPTIPVCTLKNFPYEISHTIQWARDLFDGLFNRRPNQVNEYRQQISSLQPSELAKSLFNKLGEDAAMDMANELAEDCVSFDPTDNDFPEKLKSFSLSWACKLAQSLFYDAFHALLKQHPIDSLDDEGVPFWSGSRRPPTPLKYLDDSPNPEEMRINESIVDFVRCASRLRIETYLSDSLIKDEKYMSQFHLSLEDAKAALRAFVSQDETHSNDSNSFQRLMTEKIKMAKTNSSSIQNGLNSIEFEKDDDSNGHVAFVTAASNLRALAYDITPVDAMETRRVAGRIVPAMITTTALVSALSCVELVKLIQGAELKLYRNAFVNLALPFFAFTSPLPAETVQGLHGLTFTIWDKISIQETEKQSLNGGITLRQLLRRIKKKAQVGDEKVEISNVSYGPYMLYANFLHENDDEVLDASLQSLVEDAVGSDDMDDEDMDRGESRTEAQMEEEVKALKRRRFIDFTVIVEDPETGEEGELPPVRFVKWGKS
jgi:Dinucleotide-utilizing enzymes involved in molybdopterin and thiamine biosynthesis family 2